jgi:hypothetical protein
MCCMGLNFMSSIHCAITHEDGGAKVRYLLSIYNMSGLNAVIINGTGASPVRLKQRITPVSKRNNFKLISFNCLKYEAHLNNRYF